MTGTDAAHEAAPDSTANSTASGRRDRHQAERRCLVRRESGPTDPLIRFVLGPDNQVVPDLAEKLPGRGVWVTASRADLDTAIAKRLFAQGFRAPAQAAPGLTDQVAGLLRRRCLDWIALARRAGEAVAGHDKVRGWLAEGRVVLLLQGKDASRDSTDRMARVTPDMPQAATAAPRRFDALFDASELGSLFDRDIAVHVAISSGGIARQLARDLDRLSGMVATPGDGPGDRPNDRG